MLKKSKKVVSVVLALVLVLSTMAVAAFAEFDPDTQVVGFVITPDKDLTKLSEGDTVTFTLSFDVADFSQTFSSYKLPVFFDPTVYEPIKAYTLYNDFADFYVATSNVAVVSAANTVKKLTDVATNLTARHTQFVNFGGNPNASAGSLASVGYTMTLDDTIEGNTTRSVPELSFQMTVKEGADLVNGSTDVIIPNAWSVTGTMYFKLATGTGTSFTTNANVNMELASAMANNPAEASIINLIKNQIRFGGITSATTTRDNYTNTFAVRTIAKISTDDFTAKFGTEDQAKAGITHVGFVYALNTNVDPDYFDAATAAAVAQGTPATGYVQRDVTYIQRVADGYQFTCLVEVPDENKTDGYKALAYVCFNDGTEDHWYFSSDVATVDFTTIFNTYWAQVPVA